MTHRFASFGPPLTLAAALVAGVALRLDIARYRRQFYVDEAVSYLSANAQLGGIGGALKGGLTGRWVPVSLWQQYLHAGPFWIFGRIASGLAHHDVHPPLYFWLLHVWVAVVGISPRSGVLLNTGLALLTGIALFFLARRILTNPLEAALAVAVWAVSPQVVAVSDRARQYDQYALFTVLFTLIVLRVCDLRRRLNLLDGILLSLTTAGGLLTHYQFALVVLTGSVYLLVRLVKTDRGRLLRCAAALAVAALLFVALAPQFYLSVELQHSLEATRQRIDPLTTQAFLGRLSEAWTSLYSTVGLNVTDLQHAPAPVARLTRPAWPFIAGRTLAVGLAALTAAVGLFVLVVRRTPLATRLGSFWSRVDTRGMGTVLFFLAGIGIGIYGPYLGYPQSPSVEPRYLAPLYPFVAMAVVLIARLLIGRARYIAVAALCILLLVPASLGRIHSRPIRVPAHTAEIARARHVLFDTPARGYVFRVLWWLQPDSLVYVAPDRDLLGDPQPWLRRLKVGDLYIGTTVTPNDHAGNISVERILATRFEVVRKRLGLRGVGLLDVLEERASGNG